MWWHRLFSHEPVQYGCLRHHRLLLGELTTFGESSADVVRVTALDQRLGDVQLCRLVVNVHTVDETVHLVDLQAHHLVLAHRQVLEEPMRKDQI